MQVADIQPGRTGAYPTELSVGPNGSLFFAATGPSGTELWKTDGTENGTRLLKDINTGTVTAHASPNGFVEFRGKLYFTANDGQFGSELWSYDGAETRLEADIRPGEFGSAPKELTVVGDALYFSADDGQRGRELWRTDEKRNDTSRRHDERAVRFQSRPIHCDQQ